MNSGGKNERKRKFVWTKGKEGKTIVYKTLKLKMEILASLL